MLPSWLTAGSAKGIPNLDKNVDHFVLKRPINQPLREGQEEAFFGCGCFWGAEKGFWKLPGVITTAVGYAGGHLNSPTYNQVCNGSTGHAEVVKVAWDLSKIDFSDLLKLFWECHDPTQGNRQGNDRGSQYRSTIYPTTANQMELALASKESYQASLTRQGMASITTEIKQDQQFFYAEDYHQQYLAKPGSRPYCSAMPTKVPLEEFENANFKLPESIWSNFDWAINHCVLRSNNNPIEI